METTGKLLAFAVNWRRGILLFPRCGHGRLHPCFNQPVFFRENAFLRQPDRKPEAVSKPSREADHPGRGVLGWLWMKSTRIGFFRTP